MSKQIDALKLALEALEVATTPLAKDRQEVLRAITAIREALADHIGDANKMVEQSTCKQALQVEQPAQQQEPFCYHDGRDIVGKEYADHSDVFPLYTAPKPRQWVGLTQQDMKLALEALEYWHVRDEFSTQTSKAITAIREALAEQPANVTAVNTSSERVDKTEENVHEKPAQQQEPVAWILKPTMELLWPDEIEVKDLSKSKGYKPLYTSPPASKLWVGLDETDLAVCDTDGVRLARYWERVLREKNNGTR